MSGRERVGSEPVRREGLGLEARRKRMREYCVSKEQEYCFTEPLHVLALLDLLGACSGFCFITIPLQSHSLAGLVR
jgi:hypothetical protein